MLQFFSVSGACDPDTDFLKERVIMETKKVKLDAGLLAGILMALLTVRNVVNFVRILRFQFSFSGLVAVAAIGFVAAVLLMKRRDKLLLIALGVFALDQMIWGSIVSFVSIAILLLIALVMTTEYLPQAKALAEKVWFVPAILTFIGSFIGIRYFIFATLGWALISCAAVLLCGFWLAFPERDVAELFAAVKAKAGAAASTIGDTTIAEAEVGGYCDLFKQVLLMMITFGIWFFIWIYRMTRYLNRVGGEDKRTPVKQLLLCLFVPFYLVYWTYKSAQRVDKLAAAVGVESRISTLCLILAAVLPLVAPILIQDKVNEVIGVESGSRKADFDPAEKPVMRLTAAPETVTGYCGLFKHLLLLLLTFGIWNFVWIYRMTAYLNRVEGQPQRKPVSKLLLCMFVPFYMFYWIYKSAGLIDKLGEQTGVRSKLAAPCLILSLVAGIVPHILMQGKINEIITFENSVVVAPVEEIAEECEEN